MIKSKAAKDFIEKLESVRLNLETKYFLAGIIENISEQELITHEEFIELMDMLRLSVEEKAKITY